jgi:hypothetical protein
MASAILAVLAGAVAAVAELQALSDAARTTVNAAPAS